jgi:hypothetical protein
MARLGAALLVVVALIAAHVALLISLFAGICLWQLWQEWP